MNQGRLQGPTDPAGRWLPALVLAAAGGAMAWWSWGKWPDVLIDFGRELYVPWQLSLGKVLYRDMAHFNGPLSPYLNSLLFRIFGVGLLTLVAANLAILAGLVFLLYRLLAKASDRLTATVACLFFLLVFAFGQLVVCGNYNFVCPYSHGLTHGLAFSVTGLWLVSKFGRSRRMAYAAAGGLALGLVFLTKAEVFLPAALATGAGLGLALWAERPARRRLAAVLGSFAGAAAVPPAAAFLLLWTAMPAGQALHGTLGTWPYALGAAGSEEISLRQFYGWQTGLARPGESLAVMLEWAGWYAALFVPAAALAMALRGERARRPAVAIALFAAAAGLLQWAQVPWPLAFRPLPLVVLAVGVAAFVGLLRRRGEPGLANRAILQASLAVLALGLLGKMILNVRSYHYGFALAMPAALLLVVALVGWVPAWISRRGGCGWAFRSVGLAALLVATVAHLEVFRHFFQAKTVEVGSGADAFLADGRGTFVNRALEQIAERVAPGQTLAAFPEGVMLNYLARRENPTPYLNFMPTEVVRYGEDAILAAYRARPPDFIALVHKDTTEFGVGFFGQGYGTRLAAWIRASYSPVVRIGAYPLVDDRFGILLLARRRGS